MTIPNYQQVTPSHIKELQTLLSPDRVSNDPVDVMTYAYDATKKEYPPQVVVWPETTEEVAAVMKLASEHTIPVYPRGGGTGLTGGALAIHGGILLSMERMSAVKLIDKANRLVTAQPGVKLEELKQAVQREGLFYPPDPSSAKTAALGGTLAECAGGLNCVKYGTTKDWVQQVEAVMPDGEIIRVGAKVRKSVVGYNLLQLLVGCEGTLAIITEATLRLIPYPKHRSTFIALFDAVPQSAKATVEMLDSGITPSALEFIDRLSLEAVNQYAKDSNMPVAEALLLVECDGFEPGDIREDINVLIGVCQANGATEIRRADDEEERAKLWSIRRTMSPAMYAKAPYKTNEDICVPISEFPNMLNDAYAIAGKYNAMVLCFGHAGDGNLHVNFMSHKEVDPDVEQAVQELFQAAVDRGGSISGEHGIGITKAPYLSLELGKTERRLLKDIKTLFDPKQILNPGKFLDQC